MEKTAKQIAQALAHRKWRESEKGKAYYLRKKLRDNGAPSPNPSAPDEATGAPQVAEGN